MKTIDPKKTSSIHDLNFVTLQGDSIHLNEFEGKKILFINTASECGFTSQYKELQLLHEQFQGQLVVIGFPCNQFGNQEPGSSEEIVKFCESKFNVGFLLSEKVDVKGESQHPIYQWLTKKDLNGVKNSSVKWNFQKYLVDEKGQFVDYWYSLTSPVSKKITKHLSK